MNYNNLPTLDKTVLAALDFFSQKTPTKINLKSFSFPIVAGSGNAYNTAQLLFSGQQAIVASESNFKVILKNYRDLIKKGVIKEAVVISASGEKDSIWEVKLAKKYQLKTILMTCSQNSTAARLADQIFIYDKLPEPYTYNVSTYLGMLLSASGEKALEIKKIIKTTKLPNFKKYQAFSFILPDELAAIAPMLEIKRDELFGPNLSLRAFSFGQARHAKFVHQTDKELVISFGKNPYFGTKKSRFEIKNSKKIGPGMIMALAYYLIGQIQKSQPPYFQKNIAKFCLDGPKAYGQKKPFSVIVK